MLHLEAHAAHAALSDLTAALALQPHYVAARLARAQVRVYVWHGVLRWHGFKGSCSHSSECLVTWRAATVHCGGLHTIAPTKLFG